MAHFAHIVNGKVEPYENGPSVIVISNDDCAGGNFPESEKPGQEFIASLGLSGVWKQTSYNHNFRGKFAGSGYLYIEDADIFVEPAPYPSWILNEGYSWQPPTPMPVIGGPYFWNEETVSWEQIEKETEIGDTDFAVLE